MQYELFIGVEGGTPTARIDRSTGVIKKVDITLSRGNHFANEQGQRLYEVTVHGLITQQHSALSKDLFVWSQDTTEGKVYQRVHIKAYTLEGGLVRDYLLTNMYCTNYSETFDEYAQEFRGSADSFGSFVLEMKQRMGSTHEVSVEVK